MIIIPKDKWRKWGKEVLLTCPKCDAELRMDHEIAKDGIITPSVVCPLGCGVHDMIKLEGWNG